MKTLLVGYDAPLQTGSLIEATSVNRFCSRPLCSSKLIIDLDGIRIRKDKLKEILRRSDNDIICRISDDSKIKDLVKYFNSVQYYQRDGGFNIFQTLSMILSFHDRDKVYLNLKRWKPPLRVIMKWILSNVSLDDDENIMWLQKIDEYMERVDQKIIWQMLSLISPEYSSFQRYRYRFQKVGGNEND